MAIVDEVGSDAGQGEKLSEGLGIPFGRLWNSDRQASKPPGYWPQASSVASGRTSARRLVTTRKNANKLGQGKPTRARPLS